MRSDHECPWLAGTGLCSKDLGDTTHLFYNYFAPVESRQSIIEILKQFLKYTKAKKKMNLNL